VRLKKPGGQAHAPRVANPHDAAFVVRCWVGFSHGASFYVVTKVITYYKCLSGVEQNGAMHLRLRLEIAKRLRIAIIQA
jgi:hypothetical protein